MRLWTAVFSACQARVIFTRHFWIYNYHSIQHWKTINYLLAIPRVTRHLRHFNKNSALAKNENDAFYVWRVTQEADNKPNTNQRVIYTSFGTPKTSLFPYFFLSKNEHKYPNSVKNYARDNIISALSVTHRGEPSPHCSRHTVCFRYVE